MKTKLIFIRHAEAEGNINRIFQGWTDGELTYKGHLQAERLAERLKNKDIDVIYSSNLKRTYDTAAYTAELKGLPIITSESLREINGGDWENQPWNILPTKWPKEYSTWEKTPHAHIMPNGESMVEFYDRLVSEVKTILKGNMGKNVCIFTHGTAIRALSCYLRHSMLENMLNVHWYDNTAVTVADHEDGRFKLLLEGDVKHLGNDLVTIFNQEWWKEFSKNIEKLEEY